MKKFFSAFLIGLLISFTSSAQTLVVSDVDDTVKVSNVLNLADSLQNSVLIQNHFLGMSRLYNSLDPQRTQFAYVSNAIESLMQVFHESFLIFNFFPEGSVHLRPSVRDSDFKVRTITRLIERHQPENLILIGDNGERDPLIYWKIAVLHPEIKVHTFIHQVYSVRSTRRKGSVLYPLQIGYATSVDLATHLRGFQFLSENEYFRFVEGVVPAILREKTDLMSGEAAFPAWMDCRDVVFPAFEEGNETLKLYLHKARARCSRPNLK